jgi:hypothetical protein
MEAAPVERAAASSYSSSEAGPVDDFAVGRQISKSVPSIAEVKRTAAKQIDEGDGQDDKNFAVNKGAAELCRRLNGFSDQLLKASGRKGFKREDYRRAWSQELGELGRAASLYGGDEDVKDALWGAKDCLRAMLEDSSGSGTEGSDESDSGKDPPTLQTLQTSNRVLSFAEAKCTAAKQIDGTVKESSPTSSQPAAIATARTRTCHDRQQLCRQLDAFVSTLVEASRRRDPGAEDCQQRISELAQLLRAARLFPGHADVESKLFMAVDCLNAFTDGGLEGSSSDYEDSQEEAECSAEFGDMLQQPAAWDVGNRSGRGEGFAGAPLSPCESRADHHDDPLRSWTDDDELE